MLSNVRQPQIVGPLQPIDLSKDTTHLTAPKATKGPSCLVMPIEGAWRWRPELAVKMRLTHPENLKHKSSFSPSTPS